RMFAASDLAKELGLEELYVQHLLFLMSTTHTLFGGGQRDRSGPGMSSVSLENEWVVANVLKFRSLDAVIEEMMRPVPPFSPAMGSLSLPIVEIGVLRNTAFIIMQMNPANPELEDVCNAIKEICALFGIRGFRVDDIEHQGKITDLVLQEIRRCEYLIADLSGARPNVYYEVGFAHALDKKPILYRKAGTPIHFDL